MRKFLARFRQAPVFSTVYILGAALSVASVMLVAIFLHVKTSNIYPEYSRDKLLYLDRMQIRFTPDSEIGELDWTSCFSKRMINIMRDTLEKYSDFAIIHGGHNFTSLYVDDRRYDDIMYRHADNGIFSVYDYQFIDGKPYTKEDIEARNNKAVISDRLARKIFGTDQGIVGRELNLDSQQNSYGGRILHYRKNPVICGVFKEGSRLLPQSFSEIWIATIPDDNGVNSSVNLLGTCSLILRPKDGVSPSTLREIIRTFINKYNASEPLAATVPHVIREENGRVLEATYVQTNIPPEDYTINLGSYPRSSAHIAFASKSFNINEKFDIAGVTKLYGILILMLLLIPALNLSSLISGNMDSKMSEMGIRKAFGASNGTLLRQVLNENLWLTGCGALLGLVLSWLGVLAWKDWLFAGNLADNETLIPREVFLDPAMLFAPKVFIVATAVCVLLNTLSSLIPAWWALRRPAIDAIKIKS